MIEVRPTFTSEQIDLMSRDMPRVDEALYHAGLSEVPPSPTLVDLVVKRATYNWVTGRLSDALEGFERASNMCKDVFGEGHPVTIIMAARHEAVKTDIANTN